MLTINYPRDYTQTGQHGAYRPTKRPAKSQPINIINGEWCVGSDPFPLFFTALTEAGALPKVDSELRATLQRIVSDGYNGLRLRSFSDRVWTESATNWGMWKYPLTDAGSTLGVPNIQIVEEAALVQLDKMIAWGYEEGIECFYIDLEGFDQMFMRASTPRAPGTFEGRGMQWSVEARNIAWTFYSKILLRTSTIDGTRHIDNGRIVWLFNNENGMGDSFTGQAALSWGGDRIGSNVNGSPIYTVNSTSNLTVGDVVTGSGVASGSVIVTIDSSVQVTLDKNATSGGSNRTFTFKTPTAYRWYDKMVNNVVDANGSNGYWYTEASSRLATWWAANKDAMGLGATVPAWGRAGASGFPLYASWAAASTLNKNAFLDFIDDMEVEYICDLLDRARAYRSTFVMCTGTWSYSTPRAHIGLPGGRQFNVFSEKHSYWPDGSAVAGVKKGSAITRKSVWDRTASFSANGAGYNTGMQGCQSTVNGFMDGECDEYSPNRWHHQRVAYAAHMACFHNHAFSDFNQSQAYTLYQFKADGRAPQADHSGASSQSKRLTARCYAPIIKNRYFSAFSSSFRITTTKQDIRDFQHTALQIGFEGNRKNPSYTSGGPRQGHWGGKRIFFEIDEGVAPTTDFTNYPKVQDATFDAGFFVVNTATEQCYVKGSVGMQVKTLYHCGFEDTITTTLAGGMTMPMAITAMGAAVVAARCIIRSDEKVPLFTGPMKMFIHGSEFDGKMVDQGVGGVASGGVGAAAFMANDLQTINYSATNSEVWSTTGTAADQNLMMPEGFTITFDTTNEGRQTARDLEIFGVTNTGLPVRLPSSYNSGTGAWTYVYDPVARPYPEYTLQPKSMPGSLSKQQAMT